MSTRTHSGSGENVTYVFRYYTQWRTDRGIPIDHKGKNWAICPEIMTLWVWHDVPPTSRPIAVVMILAPLCADRASPDYQRGKACDSEHWPLWRGAGGSAGCACGTWCSSRSWWFFDHLVVACSSCCASHAEKFALFLRVFFLERGWKRSFTRGSRVGFFVCWCYVNLPEVDDPTQDACKVLIAFKVYLFRWHVPSTYRKLVYWGCIRISMIYSRYTFRRARSTHRRGPPAVNVKKFESWSMTAWEVEQQNKARYNW